MPEINLLGLREAAQAMHRIKRFCGKFEAALSVLEHTNLATMLALESGESRVAPLVLLHDVSEVYFSDLPYTLKNGSPLVRDLYHTIEREIEDIYLERFGPRWLQKLGEQERSVLERKVKFFDVLAACVEMHGIAASEEGRLFRALYPESIEVSRRQLERLSRATGIELLAEPEALLKVFRTELDAPLRTFERLTQATGVRLEGGIFRAEISNHVAALLPTCNDLAAEPACNGLEL